MNEKEFQDFIQDVLYAEEIDGNMQNIETFEDAGVLGNKHGLIVRLEDGTKFYLTIQKA